MGKKKKKKDQQSDNSVLEFSAGFSRALLMGSVAGAGYLLLKLPDALNSGNLLATSLGGLSLFLVLLSGIFAGKAHQAIGRVAGSNGKNREDLLKISRKFCSRQALGLIAAVIFGVMALFLLPGADNTDTEANKKTSYLSIS